MYNRILKRPMFKRGGSSFQAQGTGITSPYDTPRKNYKIGSWGEWEEQTRELTKDPRGDWSYAAQGFSELGNPYKESGEAKMISEMLHAGAAGVRGSREKASDLEQKGELAILESQAGRKLAEEKHKRDLELVDRQAKSQWNKDFRPARAISELADSIRRTADDFTFSKENAFGVAQGEYAISQLIEQERGENVDIISDTYWKQDDKTQEWSYDPTRLSAKKVWWDPQMKKWAVFPDKDNDGKADGAPTYFGNFDTAENALLTGVVPAKSKATSSTENGKGNEIIESTDLVEKITTDLSNVEITDGVVMDEAAKAGIKLVTAADFPAHQKKAWQNYLDEDEMTFRQFKQMLQAKQTKDRTARQTHSRLGNRNITEDITVAKKATGGRIGYDEGDLVDPNVTELDELNAWWKDQLNSANWKSEIKNEG